MSVGSRIQRWLRRWAPFPMVQVAKQTELTEYNSEWMQNVQFADVVRTAGEKASVKNVEGSAFACISDKRPSAQNA